MIKAQPIKPRIIGKYINGELRRLAPKCKLTYRRLFSAIHIATVVNERLSEKHGMCK